MVTTLNSERFCDRAPAQVWATLLDEGVYLASISTMYRLLRGRAQVRERRNQARRPALVKPELVATAPNEVWSWDITKLAGRYKWTWYQLYTILDVYSRYVVGWLVAPRESAVLAEGLIADAIYRHEVVDGQLTLHAGTETPAPPARGRRRESCHSVVVACADDASSPDLVPDADARTGHRCDHRGRRRPIVTALCAAVQLAKGADPLAPVTVVAPSAYAALFGAAGPGFLGPDRRTPRRRQRQLHHRRQAGPPARDPRAGGPGAAPRARLPSTSRPSAPGPSCPGVGWPSSSGIHAGWRRCATASPSCGGVPAADARGTGPASGAHRRPLPRWWRTSAAISTNAASPTPSISPRPPTKRPRGPTARWRALGACAGARARHHGTVGAPGPRRRGGPDRHQPRRRPTVPDAP